MYMYIFEKVLTCWCLWLWGWGWGQVASRLTRLEVEAGNLVFCDTMSQKVGHESYGRDRDRDRDLSSSLYLIARGSIQILVGGQVHQVLSTCSLSSSQPSIFLPSCVCVSSSQLPGGVQVGVYVQVYI